MKIISFILLFLMFFSTQGHAATASSVTKSNITWTFDTNYTVGTFATGDYYVVAPSGLSITKISASGGEILGGTQLNPSVGGTTQGLVDNTGCNTCARYSSTLDVGDNLPLSLSPGDMIVTATKYQGNYGSPNYTWVEQAEILTVLASAPPPNSFRPALADTSRTIYSADDINYELLADLTPTSGIMSLADAEDNVARPWIDWVASWPGRQIHPNNNMPDYGGEISVMTGTIALILNCDYTDEQKEPIAIGYIQMGLDFYYNAKALRRRYYIDVAHNVGRKLPIMMAGHLLNIEEIKAIWRYTGAYLHTSPGTYPSGAWYFSEDMAIQYVTSYDVAQTSSGTSAYSPDVNYTNNEIGMPEWFHYPYSYRYRSNMHWTADPYRLCCYSGTLEGAAVVANIMGFQGNEWNHNAFFDYIKRWTSIVDTGVDQFGGYTVPGQAASSHRGSWQGNGAWMASMYDKYMDSGQNVGDNTNPIVKDPTDPVQNLRIVKPIISVSASADDGNAPGNTIDNNLATRWSADGSGQWIEFDLGSEQLIDYLTIAFYLGDQRVSYFNISVSLDKITWTEVFNGSSSGNTTAQTAFDFQDIRSRYVRITGLGNSANSWNSITEVDIH